jgi:hypothetical protein
MKYYPGIPTNENSPEFRGSGGEAKRTLFNEKENIKKSYW